MNNDFATVVFSKTSWEMCAYKFVCQLLLVMFMEIPITLTLYLCNTTCMRNQSELCMLLRLGLWEFFLEAADTGRHPALLQDFLPCTILFLPIPVSLVEVPYWVLNWQDVHSHGIEICFEQTRVWLLVVEKSRLQDLSQRHALIRDSFWWCTSLFLSHHRCILYASCHDDVFPGYKCNKAYECCWSVVNAGDDSITARYL